MEFTTTRSERIALKSILLSPQKVSAHLLSRLNPASFGTGMLREAYDRVMVLLKQRGILVTWEELVADPALSETVRKNLLKVDVDHLKTIDEARAVADKLVQFGKLRQIYQLTKYSASVLNQEAIDVDDFILELTDKLARINNAGNADDFIYHAGTSPAQNKAALDIVRGILSGKSLKFIPTGFRSFDDINQGVPEAACWLLGGKTGAGKSTLALQIADNLARSGARVCLVSLEMEASEIYARLLANITATDLTSIQNPSSLSRNVKNRLERAFIRYNKRLRKLGGMLSFYVPPEDITIEELLFTLRPYGYDAIIIDYLGLLKGLDGLGTDGAQWQKMGGAVRFCKRFSAATKTITIPLVQLKADGEIKHAKDMLDHANLAWFFSAASEKADGEYEEEAPEGDIDLLQVDMPKARNQKQFRFSLYKSGKYMQVKDNEEDIGKAMFSMEKFDDEDPEPKAKLKKPAIKVKSKSTWISPDDSVDDDLGEELWSKAKKPSQVRKPFVKRSSNSPKRSVRNI